MYQIVYHYILLLRSTFAEFWSAILDYLFWDLFLFLQGTIMKGRFKVYIVYFKVQYMSDYVKAKVCSVCVHARLGV